MPGSGKSTVGKELAGRLDYSFIDIDRLMEKNEGQPVQRILDRLGDEKFLQLEEMTVLSLKPYNAVISPGGSIVYMEKAIEFLRENSTLIYLDVPLPVIKERISREPARGIVGGSAEEVFAERKPLYERYADVTVSGERSVDSTVEVILKYLLS